MRGRGRGGGGERGRGKRGRGKEGDILCASRLHQPEVEQDAAEGMCGLGDLCPTAEGQESVPDGRVSLRDVLYMHHELDEDMSYYEWMSKEMNSLSLSYSFQFFYLRNK